MVALLKLMLSQWSSKIFYFHKEIGSENLDGEDSGQHADLPNWYDFMKRLCNFNQSVMDEKAKREEFLPVLGSQWNGAKGLRSKSSSSQLFNGESIEIRAFSLQSL